MRDEFPDVAARAHAGRRDARCTADPPPARLRRDRHREHVRRHPDRRGLDAGRLDGPAALGVAGRRRRGLYEPIHGSAPDIAGRASPTRSARSSAPRMLLRHSLAPPARQAEAARVPPPRRRGADQPHGLPERRRRARRRAPDAPQVSAASSASTSARTPTRRSSAPSTTTCCACAPSATSPTTSTVNISSPNTASLRELHQPARLAPLLEALLTERERLVAGSGRRLPLVLKLSPDLDEGALDDVATVLRQWPVDAVAATNTTITRDALPRLDADGQAQQRVGDAGARVRASIDACVIVAGCATRLSTPPSDSASEKQAQPVEQRARGVDRRRPARRRPSRRSHRCCAAAERVAGVRAAGRDSRRARRRRGARARRRSRRVLVHGHARVQRAQPAQRQELSNGAPVRPRQFAHHASSSSSAASSRTHGAADHVAVPVQVLRRRVHHDVGAERDRPLPAPATGTCCRRRRWRRLPGRPRLARPHVGDAQQRVARRLDPQQRGRCRRTARLSARPSDRTNSTSWPPPRASAANAVRAAVAVVRREHDVARRSRCSTSTTAPMPDAVTTPPCASSSSAIAAPSWSRVGLPERV
jgi:hypothetical protein